MPEPPETPAPTPTPGEPSRSVPAGARSPGGADEVLGDRLPSLMGRPPGPRSRELAERLRRWESRNVTYLSETFPVFWEEAAGSNVRDADGNVFLDLTGAFGVALAGHAHPRVVEAIREQAGRLVHGMGDVHPPAIKARLLERLGRLAPWPEARAVLASSGSEAVEIALKTAQLHSGRAGVLAFEGGYHGLTLGALAATARPYFREPFRERLFGGVAWAPWPACDPDAGVAREGGDGPGAPGGGRGPVGAAEALEAVEEILERGAPDGEGGRVPVGAVVLEPVQGRAGVRVPPEGFLAGVAERARSAGALVVADEIFTGMGRCGAPLASARLGLEPDVVCLGKALGGGMPLSACLAPARIMDAWPPSPGEALHTSTFLGHPVACAAALAVLELLDGGLADDAERVGTALRVEVEGALGGLPGVREIRGLGAMLGVELEAPDGREGIGARVAEALLGEGVLVLPAGDRGMVVELTPPVTLTPEQTAFAGACLGRVIRGMTA